MKNLLTTTLSIFCFFSLFQFNASGRNNYLKGWDAFCNNDRKEARKYFELSTENPELKADAFLSLALLDWHETNEIDAFNHFQKFYENSKNPYPYFYAVYSLPFMFKQKVLSEEQLKFYEKVVDDTDMNGTLKAMLYQRLGEDYMNRNNFKKAQIYFSKIGAVDKWQVLGNFDNISGSGFDKDWGAVSKPMTGSIFKNEVGADVTWYTPLVNKLNKWFYFDYYFPLNDEVLYAQSFVNSPAAQEVYLRAGTSGSLKIWVNDALISRVPEERNCDLDIYGYKIHLNDGANRILVQIGQSEVSGANFLVRLTDETGNPIPNISFSSEYKDYQKSDMQSSNDLLPFFAENYLENKIKEDPENLLNYIVLGETYLRNDKSYEGTHILKQAESLGPKSSFISYRLSEAYLRAQNQTNYSREIENIKLNDPTSFVALRNLFSESFKGEKYLEAESTCNQIKELYGSSLATDYMELQLLSAQRKTNELIEAAKKLYIKYPYEYEYMSLNYSIEDNVHQNTKAATALLENYCKHYYDSQALGMLADRYFSLGDTEKGLKVLRKRIESQPYASGFIFEYATRLQRMQKYNEALVAIEEVKKLAPYMPGVYNIEGYIYKEMNKIPEAKESFKKAVYYGPTSYDSRTQLRLLNNKKEVFDLFPKINLDSLISIAPSTADYPDDNSLVVMYDNQLVFYPEGAQERRSNIAVKILNQSGISEWKDYSIDYNPNGQKLILDKYEVVKTNGQKIKAETDHAGRVVFTNLEVGDVLHLDYRLQDHYSGSLAKHFYDWALMQYAIPAVYNSYAILVPEDKKFNYEIKQGSIEPVISKIENMDLYRWINTNLPATRDEAYMSPYADVVPTLVFSSIPDWKFIGNWYKDMTTNKINAQSDYVLKETFAEILKGKENAGQLDKAQLFYEYILNNITYSNVPFMQSNYIPQKASRTITTRLGDCKDVSTLFVTLCREAGIKANLVLLSSREYGKNVLALPSVNFNHCIAQLDIDGKIYYLELTDSKLPFGAALDSDLQSNILPIPYKQEEPVNQLLQMDMPFRMKNKVERETTIRVNENDMQLTTGSVRFGQLASFYRHRYADMGAEDRLKDINQIISADWKVPVKVSNFSLKHLDNLCDSVIYGYDIEAKGALQEVAGMKIFKLPWADAVSSLALVSLDERKYSLEFWGYVYCDSESEEIKITLPKGKQFVEVPKNVNLECDIASYELTFNAKSANELIVRRTFTKKKDVVSPTEYKTFKQFFNAVSENDNRQYAIK